MKFWEFKSKKPESEYPKTRRKLFYHLNNTFPGIGIDLCKYNVWFLKIPGGGVNTGVMALDSLTYAGWEKKLKEAVDFRKAETQFKSGKLPK